MNRVRVIHTREGETFYVATNDDMGIYWETQLEAELFSRRCDYDKEAAYREEGIIGYDLPLSQLLNDYVRY